MIDLDAIRQAMAILPTDHDAAGQHLPTVEEIFTPAQHASALDPNTPVVVGARGAGKSFWAGVLGQQQTRDETARAYPRLGLNRLVVAAGYTGFHSDPSSFGGRTINEWIPGGQESALGFKFWQAVIIRAGNAALDLSGLVPSIEEAMARYGEPDVAAEALRKLDQAFSERDKVLLVTFDALDTLSRDWTRSSRLVDALFEAIWALRVRRALKAKVFIRPEQLYDDSLQFVELPKLRSGRVELEWRQVDLYGLLFWRLLRSGSPDGAAESFQELVETSGAPALSSPLDRRSRLFSDPVIQKAVMERLAGRYMGKGSKNGGTYDWPFKHAGDAVGKVTPRSFLKLFVGAAQHGQAPPGQVISHDGIRAGLSEASRVRVDQLGVEYKWVKRALAPLAGVRVPCEKSVIFERWESSNTVEVILREAQHEERGFLPPFPPTATGNPLELLAAAMQRMGLVLIRDDGRVDIPDLFRVAAQMLKKGGLPPVTS